MSPQGNDGSDEEGSVLSPEELDITDKDDVVEIDEGRYVISAGDESSGVSVEGHDPVGDGEGTPPPEDAAELTEPEVHAWLEDHVGEIDARYGFDITASFEGSIDRQELFSNDVATTFEHLVMWYARHVGGDTPVEEVLGILLVESNVPVSYPPETLGRLVSKYGLGPEDSIGDLFSALDDDEGVRFPP